MPDDKLSVVIMNWARPANVVRFVGQYARHPRVGEVIVWDPSRDHPLNATGLHHLSGAPIRYIRSDYDFGLYPRYLMGAASHESGVLIVDDDIELAPGTINVLHDEYLKDPRLVHGIIGRQPTEDGSYTGETFHGAVEIVLTRTLIASPWLCGRAAAWGTRHVRDLPGTPRGNGEDILLSYTAIAESGQRNRAYKLAYTNHGYDDDNAISVRVKGHGEHRTAMVKWCRKQILGGMMPSN
jgi:hypothetical protein